MNHKDEDILSQVLGVLLEGQELDSSRLELLENKLQQIAENEPESSSEDPFATVSTKHSTVMPTINPSTAADPFGGFEEPAMPQPVTLPKEQPQQEEANTERLQALETEVGLLKQELKEAKEEAKKFELLHKRKAEESESQRQMIEMTVNHVMSDMQQAQEKLLALDDIRRIIKGLQTGIHGSNLQFKEWFPNGFFWSQQEYYDHTPYHYYCIQHFSVKYIIAVALPCEAKHRGVISIALQLLLYARVVADRYTTPSSIYEFYEEIIEEIETNLSLEFNKNRQGVVVAIDEEANEVSVVGDKLLLYQQEGNLVKALELGVMSAGDAYRMGNTGKYRVRKFQKKAATKFIIPLAKEVPTAFDAYLRELGSLSAMAQQEHLESWREREEFPADFAFIHIHLD